MSESTSPMNDSDDAGAIELLRAWLIDDALHCSLQAGVFEEPASWGTVLADLARSVASALQEADGTEPGNTLQAIKEAFLQELDSSAGAGEDPSGGDVQE